MAGLLNRSRFRHSRRPRLRLQALRPDLRQHRLCRAWSWQWFPVHNGSNHHPGADGFTHQDLRRQHPRHPYGRQLHHERCDRWRPGRPEQPGSRHLQQQECARGELRLGRRPVHRKRYRFRGQRGLWLHIDHRCAQCHGFDHAFDAERSSDCFRQLDLWLGSRAWCGELYQHHRS